MLTAVHVLSPFYYELMSPLSLKEPQRFTSSVKSPHDEPQLDPVVSITLDSLVSLMRAEEEMGPLNSISTMCQIFC